MTPTHPKYTSQVAKQIGEHKFYLVNNADEILHTRYMVAEVQELYIRAGISEEFLKGIAQLIIDQSLNSKDLNTLRSDMIAIGHNLQGRLGFIAEQKMYEELACVMFLMDDEPFEYLPEWQERKKAVWQKDKNFFLSEAFKVVNPSGSTSIANIMTVFQAVSERIAQLPTLTN